MIIAFASVPIRILMGSYDYRTDVAELFINIVICATVLRAKGNVVKLFSSTEQQHVYPGKKSENNLIDVHPDLIRVVRRAIQLSKVDFIVLEGQRTQERQRN